MVKKNTEENEELNNQTENDAAIVEELKAQAAGQGDAGADYKVVIADLNDKLLRSMAEAQNVRRRAESDIQKAKDFSIQSFAKDLLGVVDNLYRALDDISEQDAEQNEKLKSVRDGVEITRKEMVNVLERNKIQRIYPLGETFDPNLHQAISQIEDKEKASGSIIQVLQAGYIIKDRLLRPALVILAK